METHFGAPLYPLDQQAVEKIQRSGTRMIQHLRSLPYTIHATFSLHAQISHLLLANKEGSYDLNVPNVPNHVRIVINSSALFSPPSSLHLLHSIPGKEATTAIFIIYQLAVRIQVAKPGGFGCFLRILYTKIAIMETLHGTRKFSLKNLPSIYKWGIEPCASNTWISSNTFMHDYTN